MAQRGGPVALGRVGPAQVVVDVGQDAGVVGRRQRTRGVERPDRAAHLAAEDLDAAADDVIFELEPRRERGHRHLVKRGAGAGVVALEVQEIGAQHAPLPAGRLVADRLDDLDRQVGPLPQRQVAVDARLGEQEIGGQQLRGARGQGPGVRGQARSARSLIPDPWPLGEALEAGQQRGLARALAEARDGRAQQIDRLVAGAGRQVAVQRALDILLVAVQVAGAQQQGAVALRVARKARAQEIAEQAVVGQPAGAARHEQPVALDLVEQSGGVAGLPQRLAALRREVLQHAGVFQEALQLGCERRDHLLREEGVDLRGIGFDQHVSLGGSGMACITVCRLQIPDCGIRSAYAMRHATCDLAGAVEREHDAGHPAAELGHELLGAVVGERERVGHAGELLDLGGAELQRGVVEHGGALLGEHAHQPVQRRQRARGQHQMAVGRILPDRGQQIEHQHRAGQRRLWVFVEHVKVVQHQPERLARGRDRQRGRVNQRGQILRRRGGQAPDDLRRARHERCYTVQQVVEEQLRVAVGRVEGIPGHRQAAGGGPLREGGGLAPAGRRRQRDHAPGGDHLLQILQQPRPVDQRPAGRRDDQLLLKAQRHAILNERRTTNDQGRVGEWASGRNLGAPSPCHHVARDGRCSRLYPWTPLILRRAAGACQSSIDEFGAYPRPL